MKRLLWIIELLLFVLLSSSCIYEPVNTVLLTDESTAEITMTTAVTTTTSAPVHRDSKLAVSDAVYLMQDTGSTKDVIVSYVKPYDDHTLCYGFEGEPSEETLVVLDDAQIEKINSLYASIEDFSGPIVAGNHWTVKVEADGKRYIFSYLCADDKVNEYVNILFEYCGGDVVPWEVVLRYR